MQIVILLAVVIAVTFLFKKEKSPYARAIIASVFGVLFFSVWPFVVYYMNLEALPESYLLPAYIAAFLFAVVFSLFLIRLKHEHVVALLAVLVFIVFTLFTQSSDIFIKNSISIYSSYFNHEGPVNREEVAGSLNQRLKYGASGYSVLLSRDWQKQTDKGPMFEYFLLIENNSKQAEFRPKCFFEIRVPLFDIVKSIEHSVQSMSLQAAKTCYRINNGRYACKILISDNQQNLKRIRWFAISTDSNRGGELDFVIFKQSPQVLEEIERIIASVKFDRSTENEMGCIATVDWM